VKLFRALLFIVACIGGVPSAYPEPISSPRLIVILVGDQVRADYLEKYKEDLVPGGLRRFLDKGSYFTEAAMDHAVTKTGPGHILIGSGLSPSQSGVVGNGWYDPLLQREVYAAEPLTGERRVKLRWFNGPSFAQRLHTAYPRSRVISLSYKDRGALLLTGPDQDEAYWWDESKNAFVTYTTQQPRWLKQFNTSLDARFTSEDAETHQDAFDDRILEELVELVAKEWNLGKNLQEHPDVLTVSFSAVDLIGHEYGPDSPQMKEAFLNLDRSIKKLMVFLEKQVGPRILWVFTADHGVTPIPEASQDKGMPAGRVNLDKAALPNGDLIESIYPPFIYIDSKALRRRGMSRDQAAARLQKSLMDIEGVAEAYTEKELASGKIPSAIKQSYYPPKSGEGRRCGDLMVVLRPFYIFSQHKEGTNHGQPTLDDQRVPLGFYGWGVRSHVSNHPISPGVITPTLLKSLGLRDPALLPPADIF
jgi:hypothetical protein